MKAYLSKHRKLLIMLPVFLLILSGIFLIVRHQVATGSKDTPSGDDSTAVASKFNDKLPSPQLQDSKKNKFEIYMQAQRDSAEKRSSNDAYDKRFFNPGPPDDSAVFYPIQKIPKTFENLHHQEQKVTEQLQKIEAELNRQGPPVSVSQNLQKTTDLARQAEIDRLEHMITDLQQAGSTGDSELLQSMTKLEKLVHMEGAPVKLNTPVKDSIDYLKVSLYAHQTKKTVGFYGITPDPMVAQKYKRAIKAVVLGGQLVLNGSTVKLRLNERIFLEQVEIPAHTSVDGVCSINDERLLIQITQITHEGTIYPVQLSVYDQRGMRGLHAPGAITRDAAKESLAQTMQSMGNYGVSTGIASEITSSAVQGIGGLLSRKARLIKIQITSDHPVLLQ